MSGILVRLLGAAVGVTAALVGGMAAGGWWWVAAGIGASASVGGILDRHLAFAQVLASLILAAAVVDAGQGWLVAAIAAGTVASIELAAAADRTSVVRPAVPNLDRVARSAAAAAALAAAVLVVGAVSTGLPAAAPVGAALAAVFAIRVIAR